MRPDSIVPENPSANNNFYKQGFLPQQQINTTACNKIATNYNGHFVSSHPSSRGGLVADVTPQFNLDNSNINAQQTFNQISNTDKLMSPTQNHNFNGENSFAEHHNLANYKLGKTIGQGSYGKVKLAVDLRTKEKVAIKIINKKSITTPKQALRIQREIRFLKLLHHPHIVSVLDIVETTECIYIVMEYAKGGELFEYIITHKRLKNREARHFFRQIVSAVFYCHKNSVIHRDLKPENLLLDENKNIKIIDFGFSNTFQQNSLLDTFCGSPFYAAPEMILGRRYEGPEVDMWSLGVILFTLLCGHLPFDDVNSRDLYQRILAGSYSIPDHVTLDAKHLISRLINVNPSSRATIEEVMHHSWINEGYESIPATYLPARPFLDPRMLNRVIISKLQAIGYSWDTIRHGFESMNQENPVVHTYHLFVEMFKRMENVSSNKCAVPHTKNSPPTIHENTELLSSATVLQGFSSDTEKDARIIVKQRRKASLNEAAIREGTATLYESRVCDRNQNTDSMEIEETRKQSKNNITNTTTTAPKFNTVSGASHSTHPSNDAKRRHSLPILDAIMSNSGNNSSKVAATETSDMRSVSGWFFSVSTTSSLPPSSILSEIHRVLEIIGINFVQESPYILQCQTSISNSNINNFENNRKCSTRSLKLIPKTTSSSQICFEIEICRVPRLNLYGINFKRLSGSFWTYRKLCQQLLLMMTL